MDVSSLEQEKKQYRNQLRQVAGAKDKLLAMLDGLDASDRHYDRKCRDMQNRLDGLYDKITEFEMMIAGVDEKINAAFGNEVTAKQLYQILLDFDIMYSKMTDLEKKEFMNAFVDSIELDAEKDGNRRIIKNINLTFPVYYDGQVGKQIRMPDENTVETVCLLGRRKPDTTVKLEVDMEDYHRIKDGKKPE